MGCTYHPTRAGSGREAEVRGWTLNDVRRKRRSAEPGSTQSMLTGCGSLPSSLSGGHVMALFLRQCALTILIGLASVLVAWSEDWPTRNVSVVIPLPPGVAGDTTARIVFEQVGRQVGESFVIQNRPGAGGIIGANVVAKSPPDGYTALVYGSLAAATALYSKLPFDTINDFAPV